MFIRTIIILACIPVLLSGQTLNNGGLETPNIPDFPVDKSQMDEADSWEADNGSNGTHSPDWLSDCLPEHMFVFEEEPGFPSNFVPIPAQAGCKYGGMLAAEMVQQNIGGFCCDQYSITLSMYIRLPHHTWYFSNESSFQRVPLWSSGMALDIYMAKEKITYQTEDFCFEDSGSGYAKNGDGLIKVASLPISTDLYPTGEWHLVEFNFSAPSNNHDWLAFEYFTPYEGIDWVCNLDYLLFDEVNMEVTDCANCENCSPYDGCIEFTTLSTLHG